MPLDLTQATQVYRQLLSQHAPPPATGKIMKFAGWAAHIVGQHPFFLHVGSHLAMLGLAVSNAIGAKPVDLRLAPVPAGHLLGRLPDVNTGRATVSAFKPMKLDERSRRLIDAALEMTSSPIKLVAGEWSSPPDKARRASLLGTAAGVAAPAIWSACRPDRGRPEGPSPMLTALLNPVLSRGLAAAKRAP